MENIKSLEDRFVKIVQDMNAELLEAKTRVAELEAQLRIANFPIQQATICGKCGNYKHTPWKDDNYGYVCVGCLVEIKNEELERVLKKIEPSPEFEISE